MNKKPFAALIISIIIWGTTFIVMKLLTDVVTPGLMIFIRSLIGCSFLLLFCFGRFKKLNKKLLLFNILTGLFVAGGYIVQAISIKFTTTANCSFLENVYLFIVPFLSWALTKNKPTITSLFLSFIVAIGIILISFGDGLDFSSTNLLGNILAIISGVFFGFNIALTGLFFKEKDPFLYTFFQFLTVAVVSLIYYLIAERSAPDLDIPDVIALVYLGLFSTGIAWIFRNSAQNNLPPVTVSIVMPFTSVIATVVSIAIGETKLTMSFLTGALLIIGALLFNGVYQNLKKNQKEIAKKDT